MITIKWNEWYENPKENKKYFPHDEDETDVNNDDGEKFTKSRLIKTEHAPRPLLWQPKITN